MHLFTTIYLLYISFYTCTFSVKTNSGISMQTDDVIANLKGNITFCPYNKKEYLCNYLIKLYNYEYGINTIEYPSELRPTVGACEAVIPKRETET